MVYHIGLRLHQDMVWINISDVSPKIGIEEIHRRAAVILVQPYSINAFGETQREV